MNNKKLMGETLVSFGEGHRLPQNPSRTTLTRWAFVGVESTVSGQTVMLEHVQIGARYYTSTEAFERFVARLNEGK